MKAATLPSLAAAMLFVPSIMTGQAPERHLEPNAEFPEGFALIGGLREMPNGRLMVSDALGQLLAWVDMDNGVMEVFGREGRGPREYETPDALYRWRGDSTLLVDLGNSRLTVLDAGGEFIRSMPITRELEGRLVVTLPRGVDSQGRIYFQPFGMIIGRPRPGGRPQLPDSGVVARWNPRTDVIDTLGMIKLEDRDVQTSGGGNENRMLIGPVPMSPRDAWAVAPDGRVAVARSPEYRLDWLSPDGTLKQGPPVSFDPVRVRRAEKEQWVIDDQRGGINVGMTINNGARQMSFSRSAGADDRPDVSRYEFPETMPPFGANAVLVAPSGEAWVQRNVSAGSEALYDVFDSNGNLKERVYLPEGREIVGFGNETVYAVYYDEFDLQWLERYGW